MKVILDLQNALQNHSDDIVLPSASQVEMWIQRALLLAGYQQQTAELTVRFVDPQEMIQLNHEYRGKNKTTNVLTFPFEVPEPIESDLLGDIVICPTVIAAEALAQQKTVIHHWAHMVVHGCLHLLGFDHLDDAEAEEMEALEASILKEFAISNPYFS
ncbi:rRNA maturation RNase YbeY [Aliikangiella sp. IMCC44653]